MNLHLILSSHSIPIQTHLSSSAVKKQNVKNKIIREKEDNNKAVQQTFPRDDT
jgi:hypothetical protein